MLGSLIERVLEEELDSGGLRRLQAGIVGLGNVFQRDDGLTAVAPPEVAFCKKEAPAKGLRMLKGQPTGLEDVSQGLGKLGDSGGSVTHGDDAFFLAAEVKADA